MDKKRVVFSEQEKTALKQLVIDRRQIVENKKSDLYTLLEKKKAWDGIAADFNESGEFPRRTVVQLKRLWENIKARSKSKLNRDRIKTGGESSREIPVDPELDSLGLDDEIQGAVDSDIARLLVVKIEPAEDDVTYEPYLVEDNLQNRNLPITEMDQNLVAGGTTSNLKEETPVTKEKEKSIINPKLASRVRHEQFLRQAEELHKLKMEEQRGKIELVKLQIHLAKLENQRARQLHKAKMQNLKRKR